MTPVLAPLVPAPSSALPSPPTSPTSPRPTTARIRIKRPVSLINVDVEGEGRTRSMSPPLSKTIAEPNPSSEARASAKAATTKRRQSSIAYYTPSSPSPWNQMNRTLSSGADGPRDGEPFPLNSKENLSQRSSLILSSRSPSTRESVSSSDGMGVKERGPLTLVEKHADLLRFIAQKERKCLELRDQLIIHEKELAELKHKWECIVNNGHDHDPTINIPLTATLSGAALDGLKEGVRMIAAGFSDFGGVIQDLDNANPAAAATIMANKPKTLAHRQNTSDTSYASTKRTGSVHLSISSTSSVYEHVRVNVSEEGGEGEVIMTAATAPSFARAGSLNRRVHKRTARAITQDPTTPTTSVAPPLNEKLEQVHLNEGMGVSILLSPNATVTSAPLTTAPKSQVLRPASAGPMASWMDNMGRKLSGLQKADTFSKSQKRASSILASVSSTISMALLPGPTATTPAPYPTTPSHTSTSTSTTKTRPGLDTLAPAPGLRPSLKPKSKPQLGAHVRSQSQPHLPSKTTPNWDWLDNDEERAEEVNRGALSPGSKWPPPPTGVGTRTHQEGTSAGTVSSFENDGWGW